MWFVWITSPNRTECVWAKRKKHYISQAARANDKNRVSSCLIEEKCLLGVWRKSCFICPALIMYYISDIYNYGNNNQIYLLLSWGNLLCYIHTYIHTHTVYTMMSVVVSVVYDITISKFNSLWSCNLSTEDQTCFPWRIVVMLWFLLFLWMKLNLYSVFLPSDSNNTVVNLIMSSKRR